MRPEIASQELDALFVSLEGMSIFPLASLLENGEPVPDDGPIDTIGVAIDSAAGEGGFEHDGTAAIVYGMRQPRVAPGGFEGGQVVILDWDIRSPLSEPPAHGFGTSTISIAIGSSARGRGWV